MTEAEYRSTLRQIRKWIDRGGGEDLCKAEEGIDELRSVYPKRLPYICAEVELMLAKGEDAEKCRNVIDYVVQEFYPQEGLSDIFALKRRTYTENSPEHRQLDFLVEFYQTGVLPQQPFDVLDDMKEHLLVGQTDLDELHALAEQYYVTRNTLLSAVLMMAWCKRAGHMEDCENYILQDAGQPYPHPVYKGNFGYLARMFTDGGSYTFLLIDDAAGDRTDIDVLANVLHLLGQNVIILREYDEVLPVQDINTYALSCIQDAQTERECIVITVGKCRMDSDFVVDATPAVIRLLTRSISQDAPLIVFARDGRMGELHARTALAGDIQRLSHCLPKQFSYGLSFAWTGDYLKYISYLYGESAETLLAAPASCDFSIVIPVRNSADTLRHTLKTCLAMDYAGSYEVVLSDNSDEGCTAVRELYEEIGDPRIRYYKTPISLPLDKSFEFAFLHAHGEFIFSIGADDGVYPWALTYLKKALADHPKEPMFSWNRGFYTWPALLPYDRSILQVPLYEAEVSALYHGLGLYSNHRDIVEHIDDIFYNLPLFYINSGFRRSYLHTLRQRTGRLLDGIAQDAYMATVNLFLNDHVVHINCPLTTAGMSGYSIGAGTLIFNDDVAAVTNINKKKKYLCDQMGEYVLRDGEYRVPYIDTADKLGFYMSVIRLQEMGVIHAEVAEDHCFDYFGKRIYLTDVQFERFCGMLLYAASQCGIKKYRQCRAFYEAICAQPKQVENPQMELFSDYKTGYSAETEKLTLDAKAFDCYNVADVVRLTARILNL